MWNDTIGTAQCSMGRFESTETVGVHQVEQFSLGNPFPVTTYYGVYQNREFFVLEGGLVRKPIVGVGGPDRNHDTG